MTFPNLFAAALLAVLVSVVVRSFTFSATDTAAGRLAQSLRLPIPQERATFILKRTAIRQRSTRVGLLVGYVVGLAVVWPLGPRDFEDVWVVLAFATLGWMAALSTASLLSLERTRSAGVARATAVGLDDYVAPGVRTFAGIAAAVAIVLAAIGLRMHGFDAPTWIGVGATLISVGAAEVVGRRLIQQRQPADSDLELAWNDALRSQVVRDLFSTPLALAAATMIPAVATIVGPSFGLHLIPLSSLALNLAVMLGTRIAKYFEFDRYVLRRLWSAQLNAGWN